MKGNGLSNLSILEQGKYHINLYRRYRYWKNEKCIFIHVPKVAGTSINKAIYGKTLGHYKSKDIKNRFPTLYENCFTFGIVRNPWDRLVSAYNFVKVEKTESMGVYKPEQYRIKEFDSFESFIENWLAFKDTSKLDYIFQDQKSFLYNNNRINVDFIGKIEDMDKSVKTVSQNIGRNISIRHFNSTKKADYRTFYSDKTAEIVSNIYKEDINTFEYRFN